MMSLQNRQSLERDLFRFEPFLSQKFGLIRSIRVRPIPAGGPKLFWVEAESKSNIDGKHAKQDGSGISSSLESAICRALGETIERHSSMFQNQIPILKKISAKQIVSQGKTVANLALLPKGSLPFHLLSNDEHDLTSAPMDWVMGRFLDDQSPVWVPATAVFFGYPGAADSNSNGLACGKSESLSLASALSEVIERDSFMHIWWRREQWNEIEWKQSLDLDVQAMGKRLGSWGQKVRLFTLADSETSRPQHGIHSVFAIYRSNEVRDSKFLLAGAASIDFKSACFKAITELAVIHLSLQTKSSEIQARKKSNDFDREINSFFDGITHYAKGADLEQVEFLLKPLQSISLDRYLKIFVTPDSKFSEYEHGRIQLSAAIDHCQSLGARPIAVELTTRDVSREGLYVHRVLVPELVPLNAAHRFRPISHPRLKGSYRSPFASANIVSVEDHEMNKFPHPFP